MRIDQHTIRNLRPGVVDAIFTVRDVERVTTLSVTRTQIDLEGCIEVGLRHDVDPLESRPQA